MFNSLKFIIFFYIYATSLCFAQTISSTPRSVLPMGIVRTGNTVKTKCDGLTQDHVRLTIQPSCYGINLRGGGTVLDPNKGKVILDLKIKNGPNTFSSTIDFPNKITWPRNYGQTCIWNNLENNKAIVDCDSVNPVVRAHYTCSYVVSPTNWFLNHYLSCLRTNDPNNDQTLNQNIECSFLWNWQGSGLAAVNSYTRIINVANCGIEDKPEILAPQVHVNNALVAPAKIDIFAQRGKVIVDYNLFNIQKINATLNSTTGKFAFSGAKSNVSASFFQDKDANKVALSQRVEVGFDEFEECLDIKAFFIGQNQFCGSFYSPLMLFFDEHRPLFVGRSSFPLVAGAKIIAWPENHSAGYFLAFDELGNKKIVKGRQLFGEASGVANGFEALNKFDSNKDGVIDEKDKNFKKLLLWRDLNGNGISEAAEVFSLKDKDVKKIMLNYKDDNRKSYGRSAEAREYSTFIFGEKNSKGEIVDVWFSPLDIKRDNK